jgi:hypothetical protein
MAKKRQNGGADRLRLSREGSIPSLSSIHTPLTDDRSRHGSSESPNSGNTAARAGAQDEKEVGEES